MLEETITQLAKREATKMNLKIEYEIQLKAELPPDSKNRDRIALIRASSIPIICISRSYILACLTAEERGYNHIHLRDTIERCLEWVPRMQRTLSLVPVADAISLRKDSRRWARSLVPEIRTEIPDRWFEISNIQVTMVDRITGTEITKNGKEFAALVYQTKKDLSRMILANEEMLEWREMVEEINANKKNEAKPAEVSIMIGNGEKSTTMDY